MPTIAPRKRFTIIGQAGYTPPDRLTIALTPAAAEFPAVKDLLVPFWLYITKQADVGLAHRVYSRLERDMLLEYSMNTSLITTELDMPYRIYKKHVRSLRMLFSLYRRMEHDLGLPVEVIGSRESPSRFFGGG